MQLGLVSLDDIQKLKNDNPNKSYRCETKTAEIINADVAETLFDHLYDNVTWEEGVRSRKGFTRLAKPLLMDDEVLEPVLPYLLEAIDKLKPKTVNKYAIMGIYLNLYENGEMWTPNHTHPKQHQVVMSLGAERNLTIGKTNYKLKSGHAVIFGSSIHGVPKDPQCDKPRISIATFMTPIE